MKKFLNKHLATVLTVIWIVLISLVAIFLTSCSVPEGYKKNIVWHRVTNVEAISIITSTPFERRYKITIDDTIEHVSLKKFQVGDSIPFIYITPIYKVK